MKLLLSILASALVLLTEAQFNAQFNGSAVFNIAWTNNFDSCTLCKAHADHVNLKKYSCDALRAAVANDPSTGFIAPIGCSPYFTRVPSDVTKVQVNYVLEVTSLVKNTLTIPNFNAQTTTAAATFTALKPLIGSVAEVRYTGSVTTAGQLNDVTISRVLGVGTPAFTKDDIKFLRQNPNYGDKECSVLRPVGIAPKNETLDKLYKKCLGQRCFMKDMSLASKTDETDSTVGGAGFIRRDSDIIHCMCKDAGLSVQYPFGLRTDTDSLRRQTCSPRQVGAVETRAAHRCPAGCLGKTCNYILQFVPQFNQCNCGTSLLRRNDRYCATKCPAGWELIRTTETGQTEALYKTCQKCPKGTYNTGNTLFTDRCKVCPTHKTTAGTGSTAVAQCNVDIPALVVASTTAATTTAATTTTAPTTTAPTTAEPTTAEPTTAEPTTTAPTTAEPRTAPPATETQRTTRPPATRRPVTPSFSPSLIYSGFAMLAGLGLL